jgi:hypothetical protein
VQMSATRWVIGSCLPLLMATGLAPSGGSALAPLPTPPCTHQQMQGELLPPYVHVWPASLMVSAAAAIPGALQLWWYLPSVPTATYVYSILATCWPHIPAVSVASLDSAYLDPAAADQSFGVYELDSAGVSGGGLRLRAGHASPLTTQRVGKVVDVAWTPLPW